MPAVCFTGKAYRGLVLIKRTDLEALCRRVGWTFHDELRRTTDYLVSEGETGARNTKQRTARHHGIREISYKTFFENTDHLDRQWRNQWRRCSAFIDGLMPDWQYTPDGVTWNRLVRSIERQEEGSDTRLAVQMRENGFGSLVPWVRISRTEAGVSSIEEALQNNPTLEIINGNIAEIYQWWIGESERRIRAAREWAANEVATARRVAELGGPIPATLGRKGRVLDCG